jgi:hypothetical protein
MKFLFSIMTIIVSCDAFCSPVYLIDEEDFVRASSLAQKNLVFNCGYNDDNTITIITQEELLIKKN